MLAKLDRFGYVDPRRGVSHGEVCDIHVASSGDAGATWSNATGIAEDDWRLNACPHSGASLAALGKRLFVATGVGDGPAAEIPEAGELLSDFGAARFQIFEGIGRDIDNLQIQFSRTKNKIEIAEGIKLTEVCAVGRNLLVVTPAQDLRSAQGILDALTQQPGESEAEKTVAQVI
jgi:hypothetical protein